MPENPSKELVKFIVEARRRGFDDYEIKAPLIKQGWPSEEVECAFDSLKEKDYYKSKNKVEIYLDNELLKLLEKRAKKNLLTLPEMIEDILRRSTISMKRRAALPPAEKLDDALIKIFSRRKSGRPRNF
jgi:hypothetical protein